MTTIDHTLLQGVPNNAFTEALAFVFQARDLELLGLAAPTPRPLPARPGELLDHARDRGRVAGGHAGLALALRAPRGQPAEFRAAVVQIAQETWNRWFAPIFGQRDSALLGIYSHMLSIRFTRRTTRWPPDRVPGRGPLREAERADGAEFERICQLGR